MLAYETSLMINMKWWHRRKRKKRTAKDTPRRVLLRQIFWGVFSILIVSGVGYGVWYISHVPALTIQQVVVTGGETISHAEVQTAVEDQLVGDYVHLIPKHFVWLYPHEAIVNALHRWDRIKDISVERDGQILQVYFTEYRPTALWCSTSEVDSCLFLDQSGFAFAEAPQLKGASFVRYSEVDHEPVVRTHAFDSDFLQSAETFIQAVHDQLGFNIIQVEKRGMDGVIYSVAGGGEIKVSTRMSPEETLDNLTTILQSQKFSHLAPGNFQYIDLRYGNKVFVNEEQTPATTTASTTVGTEEE